MPVRKAEGKIDSPRPKVEPREQPPATVKTATPYIPRLVSIDLDKDTAEPIKGIRKAMAKTMIAANAIPHFGYCEEVDLTSLVKLRAHLKASSLSRGVPFSYMPIFMKVNLTFMIHVFKCYLLMYRMNKL